MINGLDNNPLTVPPIEEEASARISLRELPDKRGHLSRTGQRALASLNSATGELIRGSLG